MTTLLDKYMPQYDVTEVHSIRIQASPETGYNALMELSVTEISDIVRFLFWLRALPEKPAAKRLAQLNYSKPFLKTMLDNGFTALAEQPPAGVRFRDDCPRQHRAFLEKSGDEKRFFKRRTKFYGF
jgi:hypothetical protein